MHEQHPQKPSETVMNSARPQASNHRQWKWPWSCLPTPQYCSTGHLPSDHATLHSSDWSFNDSTGGISAPNPLCGADSVEEEAAFATTWCNEFSVAIQHILQEMTLETGSFWARALINRRAQRGERKASSASKEGQKWKRRIRKVSQDKELAAEEVQCEAEERWTAGRIFIHDFHDQVHYSSCTWAFVAMEPRRPPNYKTKVGTETAFRRDHCKRREHNQKSKHVWGQRSIDTIKLVYLFTYIDLHTQRHRFWPKGNNFRCQSWRWR